MRRTSGDAAKRRVRPGQGRSLAVHLAMVVALKVLLLALIWWLFVQPYRVRVDEDGMERRLVGLSAPDVVLKEKDRD